MGMPGWQEYWTVTSEDAAQVVPSGIPAEDMLSIYGATGVTAYFGLLEIGRPQPGETVVVSGAAGGVGSVAGQLARIKDAGRVVGIAGTDEKCRWVVEDLGFDACINYKTEDVDARLHETCPDGIDVFFDNVGGEILDTVLNQINVGARIVMCGAISEYTRAESPGLKNYKSLIMQRGRMEGFIILDYIDRFAEAIMELVPMVADGRIKYDGGDRRGAGARARHAQPPVHRGPLRQADRAGRPAVDLRSARGLALGGKVPLGNALAPQASPDHDRTDRPGDDHDRDVAPGPAQRRREHQHHGAEREPDHPVQGAHDRGADIALHDLPHGEEHDVAARLDE